MKLGNVLTALVFGATVTTAAPIDGVETSARDLEARSLITRKDLEEGDSRKCPKVILIYARGSNEPGNLGLNAGPPLVGALDDTYEDMWVQGVGGPYTGSTAANFLPLGTNQESIDEAKRLFTMAHDKCPDSVVLAGGYSQGTAVVGNALTQLASESGIHDQVAGVVLFGYTKNKENGGKIADFPEEKTRVYCETGDLVCYGILFTLPSHFMYPDDAAIAAPIFLRGRVDVAKQAGGWWKD